MVTAYLLLKVKPEIEDTVAKELAKLKEVKDACSVYGEYDIIMKVSVPTMNKLQEFVMNLRDNNKIERSSTLISTITN